MSLQADTEVKLHLRTICSEGNSQERLVRDREKQDNKEEEEEQRCCFTRSSSLGSILKKLWSVPTPEFILAWRMKPDFRSLPSVRDWLWAEILALSAFLGIYSKWFYLSKITSWSILNVWAIRKGASRRWHETCTTRRRSVKGSGANTNTFHGSWPLPLIDSTSQIKFAPFSPRIRVTAVSYNLV